MSVTEKPSFWSSHAIKIAILTISITLTIILRLNLL
jgi:hypothetical protein